MNNQKQEIWQAVNGYENIYAVSNFGKVKRTKQSQGARKEHILSSALTSDGYLILGLYKNKKRKSYRIHRLVVEAFIDKIPYKMEVNHKDGNKLNNFVDNLEIVTHAENVFHAFQSLGRTAVRNCGEKAGGSIIKEQDVIQIRKMAKNGISQTEIASRYPICRQQINRIINRKRWKHI